MSTTQISFRYAHSLFKLAQEEGNLEAVYLSFSNLGGIFRKVPALSEFTNNPLLSFQERGVILTRVFEGKLHALVFKFLLFVNMKNRLSFLERMIDAFDDLYCTAKNRVHAQIITAMDVSAVQKNDIVAHLNSKYGQEILPEWKINPGILGGFKIFIEGKLYDSSLSSQLEEFKQKVLT